MEIRYTSKPSVGMEGFEPPGPKNMIYSQESQPLLNIPNLKSNSMQVHTPMN